MPLDQLRKELDEIVPIALNVLECFKIYELLSSNFSDRDMAYTVFKNSFFMFTRDAIFDQIVLDLVKLFQYTERYNLKHFISKFRTGEIFETTRIDDVCIKAWSDQIRKQQKTIDELVRVRGKAVAHKDQDALTTTTLTKANLRALIECSNKIIGEIYSLAFDTSWMPDHTINSPLANLNSILEVLVSKKKDNLACLRLLGKQHGLDDSGNDLRG